MGYLDPPPDPTEKRVRFGCGTLVGGVIGAFVVAHRVDHESGWILVASVLVCAVLVGYMAMKEGDTVWSRVARIVHWPWR